MKFGECFYFKYYHASCKGTETRVLFFLLSSRVQHSLTHFPSDSGILAVSSITKKLCCAITVRAIYKSPESAPLMFPFWKKRLKHTTIHSQDGWYKIRSILTCMEGHHGAVWRCSSCNGISDSLEKLSKKWSNYISAMVWQRWCWEEVKLRREGLWPWYNLLLFVSYHDKCSHNITERANTGKEPAKQPRCNRRQPPESVHVSSAKQAPKQFITQ